MKTFIKWLFGIFLFQTMGVTGQEVDPKVKVLLPPSEPQGSAKNGNNASTNAKIESSKGNNTLPPGLNTTQMVAGQYRNSGALKPYTPSNVGQAPPGTSKAMVNTAGKVLAGPPGSASGSNPLKGPEKFQEGSKKLKSTNQYESATSPLGGTNAGSIPPPVSGANRVPNSANAAGNTYDKVPYLNPYQPAPNSPANQYGSLQLKQPSQNSNGNYGSLQLKPVSTSGAQGANNTYGPPPYSGGANAGKPSSTYGPAPAIGSQQGSNNTYGPPPNAGGQNNAYGAPPRTGNQSSNTYGPPPNAGGQNNTYGAPPRTGNQSPKTYGPPPNVGGQNNTYGAPPRTGGANAGKPSSTYGPAPALNAQGANNTYGPPPYTGGANAGKPNGTYGPAPATGQSGQALPSTNSGYSKAPPPATGGQSAGSVPAAPPQTGGAGVNPKVLKKSEKGGAIKVSSKSSQPVKR
jgi:hypothetical protein